jgi:pimeloyl-ACP methyl ester carboxylesterase
LCLGFGVAAAWLSGVFTGRWVRAVAMALPLVLAGAGLYGAYGWRPGEQRGYRSPYLSTVASQYLETPVARFHYVRQGSGGSPVVLLSPGAAWLFAWKEQLAVLSRTHTVYVVDLPGQGFTQVRDPHFSWDLKGMTAAIDGFLTAARLPAVALAGNSWSGGWALAYTQRHPERVSRLVLLAPSGLHERDPMSWEALKMPAFGELLTNLGSGRGLVASSVRALFAHKERATAEVVDAMWAPGTLDANRRATYRLERGLDWRETERAMPRTPQPVLVVWGRQDTVLPVRQAQRFGALLPNARVHVLDGCGHALTLDCPGPVDRLMEDFLR